MIVETGTYFTESQLIRDRIDPLNDVNYHQLKEKKIVKKIEKSNCVNCGSYLNLISKCSYCDSIN